MDLDHDEVIIKVFHHHPVPFLWKAFKIVIISFPFFFVASFFQGILSKEGLFLICGIIALFFIAIIAYFWLLFFLDKLVITNHRITHVDWRNLFSRQQKDIDLEDAFDIKTQEKGLLSSLKLFDYGTFEIDTESSETPLVFENAKDPEGIKDFIYHLDLKPSKIEQTSSSNIYDSERKKSEETNGIGPTSAE